MGRRKKDDRVAQVAERIRTKMQPWGVTVSFLASRLGVSRQYAWQIVHYRTAKSYERACEIELVVDRIIAEKSHMNTFGERLRAAGVEARLQALAMAMEVRRCGRLVRVGGGGELRRALFAEALHGMPASAVVRRASATK